MAGRESWPSFSVTRRWEQWAKGSKAGSKFFGSNLNFLCLLPAAGSRSNPALLHRPSSSQACASCSSLRLDMPTSQLCFPSDECVQCMCFPLNAFCLAQTSSPPQNLFVVVHRTSNSNPLCRLPTCPAIHLPFTGFFSRVQLSSASRLNFLHFRVVVLKELS